MLMPVKDSSHCLTQYKLPLQPTPLSQKFSLPAIDYHGSESKMPHTRNACHGRKEEKEE